MQNKVVIVLVLFFLCGGILNAQNAEAPEELVSVRYNFMILGYSALSAETGSILTWRDIFLNGGEINARIKDGLFARIGVAGSFHGYHTDDDALNDSNTVSVADSKVLFLECAVEARPRGKILGWGFDFNWIRFENYSGKSFISGGIKLFSSGLLNTYNSFRGSAYGTVNFHLIDSKVVYADARGSVGTGFNFVAADWIRRPDFAHPVSFVDYGIFFKTAGEAEAGVKINSAVLFFGIKLMYEINPYTTLQQQFHENGDMPVQFEFIEVTRFTVSSGIKLKI